MPFLHLPIPAFTVPSSLSTRRTNFIPCQTCQTPLHHCTPLHPSFPIRAIPIMTFPVPTRSASAPRAPPPPTLLCVPLTGTTIAAQLSQLASSIVAGANIAELRIDLLDPSEREKWVRILQQASVPLIVTNRAAWEGGNATEEEPDRLGRLIDAVESGVEYVDVELKAVDRFWELMAKRGVSMGKTKLIVSKHDFQHAMNLEEIRGFFTEVGGKRGDVAKVAMMAESAMDNCTVFSALMEAPMPAIVLAMGELGKPSRILAGRFGGLLTFASVNEGGGSAPGQVDVMTMIETYRFREIGPRTRMYGVIGNPVAQSMGPVLHNAAFRERGLDAVYVHLLVEEDVAGVVRELSKLGFWGFSVTLPWKLDVMKAADDLGEDVQKIGAMNTVIRGEDGRLKGQNTDWEGALDAVCMKTGGNLDGMRVLVVGAGGAGKALVFGALEKGAREVVVANRTKEKAVRLAEELGERVVGVGIEDVVDLGEFDIIMNSTSVGMVPKVDESAVDVRVLREGMIVFDAVYNPLETRMLREAKERGAICVSGVEMFVGQAASQFKAWFPEVESPIKVMREKVLARLR